MSSDSLEALTQLLAHLRQAEGTPIPTTTLGRLRRTAAAGARAGMGALAGRFRGEELNLGALSPEALARLVESFGELKGVAMKAGQIMSYVDGSLAPEARQLLAVLQVHSQPTPFEKVRQVIVDDLGERGLSLLERLETAPVATASIGQVHRACLEDGTQVAVKVRHPGIEEAIRADFRAASIGKVMAGLFAPGVSIREVIAEAEERFLEECDYSLEAARQSQFASLYAHHPDIRIPGVHTDWCGKQVLTTTWHEGMGLETFLASQPSDAVRMRASRALYTFYVGTLYQHGLFNADPHPGNILFAPDGSLTLLDHGCVRAFEGDVVRALIALSRAVRKDDKSAIQDALALLGVPRADKDYDISRSLLRGFFAPLLTAGPHVLQADRAAGMGETVQLKRAIMKLNLPGKLMFLFRIRFGLYAVLARLGACLDWAALEDELSEPAFA